MNKNPVIDDQVIANRRAFVAALAAEDPNAQCDGQMFDKDKVTGKERRCALGVAAALFLGIHNVAEYKAYHDNYTAGSPNPDAYGELEVILGIKDSNEIYRLNDAEEGFRPFREVGVKLVKKWGLDK